MRWRITTLCDGLARVIAAFCAEADFQSHRSSKLGIVHYNINRSQCSFLHVLGPDLAFTLCKFLGPRCWRSVAASCKFAVVVISDPRFITQLAQVVRLAICGHNTTLLGHVTHNGSAEGAFCFLVGGSKNMLEDRDRTHGRTVLMEATYFGAEPATIALLLQQQADPNAQSFFGSTALLSACYMQGIQSIKLLLEYRADPWLADMAGDNALHCAAYSGNLESVQIFLDAGVAIDTPNHSGWTALRYAYQEGHAALVEDLKQLGANECHGDRACF